MRDAILQVLKSVRGDVDFENETNMIDGGILDSFDIISIIGCLAEQLNIELSVDDLEPENFNSLDAIIKMVESNCK